MNPKDKARNLVDKYLHITAPTKEEYCKLCALIAIDELKFFHESLFFVTKGSLLDQYLDKVKIEIEKL